MDEGRTILARIEPEYEYDLDVDWHNELLPLSQDGLDVHKKSVTACVLWATGVEVSFWDLAQLEPKMRCLPRHAEVSPLQRLRASFWATPFRQSMLPKLRPYPFPLFCFRRFASH